MKRPPIVCHGHTRPIVDLYFSHVTEDGYFLASASKDGLPMLRFGESGDWYGTFFGHKGAVWACVLDREALRAATGSADFTARVWDACKGEELHAFKHDHVVRTVQFSNDSSRLATGGMDKKIRLYDLARPDAEPFVLADAGANVRCCSWIQADALLLCSLQDRNGVAVYDVRTQRVVGNLDTAAPVTSIDVTYDGAAITTADKSHVRMWDAGRLTLAREFGMEFPVEAASYCPAKGLFAVGGEDMWVRLFSAKTGVELECNKGHHGPVHTIRFNPHGTAYASGSEDGTIRLWMVDDADDSATKTDQQ